MAYLLIHFDPEQDVDEVARAYGDASPAFHVHDEWHDHLISNVRHQERLQNRSFAVVAQSIEDARATLGRALFVSLDMNSEFDRLSGSLHKHGLLISPRQPLATRITEDQHVSEIVEVSKRLVPESRVEIVE
jgi:hypothetical protein